MRTVAMVSINKFRFLFTLPRQSSFYAGKHSRNSLSLKKWTSMPYFLQLKGFHNTPRCLGLVPFKLSDIGEGITEVIIKEWYVKAGDKVSQFDNICEVQSDKASVTITSRYDGKIAKLCYNVDDVALVGQALLEVEVEEDSDTSDDEIDNIKEVEIKTEDKICATDKVLATPAVRRLAKEKNVDLKDVKASGKHGRVLKDDIFAYLELGKIEKINVPEISGSKIKLRGVQKAMLKTMTIANNIPHFVYSDEVSLLKLIEFRDQLKEFSHDRGVKITFMPFFMKAASNCLLEHHQLNSSLDDDCEHIIIKSNHNIGVAMDTPAGLVVPNIKNVEKLNIIEIAKELNRLQNLASSGKLRDDDLKNGTFTISNIGSIGGTYMKPVILHPEVAICAIGKIQDVPRFDESDKVIKDRVIFVSWAADHRIIDGATMAKFSNLWKQYLTKPISLWF